jgi:hypothetical protein
MPSAGVVGSVLPPAYKHSPITEQTKCIEKKNSPYPSHAKKIIENINFFKLLK